MRRPLCDRPYRRPQRKWLGTPDGGYRLDGSAWTVRPILPGESRYRWMLTGYGEEQRLGPPDLAEALGRAELCIDLAPFLPKNRSNTGRSS